jgi:hypothetical protein
MGLLCHHGQVKGKEFGVSRPIRTQAEFFPLKQIVMPEALALPQSPDELLERLFAIFPQYRTAYAGPIHDDAPTFHSVLVGFTPFFGSSLSSFSERQLQSFGALVSAAVEAGGALENAFGTCLLEHLSQIRALRGFRPYLSKLAREKTKA